MAKTARQTAIFGVEDWKRLYQTYREADFQSYDFETLRKSFVDYLRLYYPETFNDYIESSEFIALLDVMAFMGQALAFRNDLNARENFLDTAERRDSVVRLANLVSYTPKRNQAAQSYMKVFAVQTTESITDFNGVNLSNVLINWNDPTNPNWLEQFTYIVNASLVDSQKFGRPGNNAILQGIRTDEYTINLIPGYLPVVPYSAVVDNINMPFEIVSATSRGKDYVYEVAPAPSSSFNVLYRNDQLGFGSGNTGFFFLFKQGTLQNQDFNLAEAIPNRAVNINIDGVNNEDYWLYELTDLGTVASEWQYAESIYAAAVEQLAPNQRKIYSITSRANDQITLTFGDGVFAETPVGFFRSYVRASNGLTYIINPEEMQSVQIPISYISRFGRLETITFVCGITNPVANAQPRESLEEIKQRAPARYYTQNRMVNGEDYNLFPFTRYNSIIKSKSVVRASVGTNRYIDLNDPTGKYSSTNIFASDGVLYRENALPTFDFDWVSRNDIVDILTNSIEPLLTSRGMTQFYYANFPRPSLQIIDLAWNQSTTVINATTGYFYNTINLAPQNIGIYSSNNAKFITQGSLIKFIPPAGFFFDARNQLVAGTPVRSDEKLEIWATASAVVLDGNNSGLGNFANGEGPVTLNTFVPTGALAQQVIPKFVDDLPSTLEQSVLQQVELQRNFGLGYNNLTSTWYLITSTNLAQNSAFSLSNAQNTQGLNLDASWLIQFQTTGTISSYTVTSRSLDYVFASVIQTRFYFDGSEKVYDSRTGKVINDFVNVLKTNAKPDSNQPLTGDVVIDIIAQPVQSDGYVNDFQVLVSYQDSDSDGVADNPDFFDQIVAPAVDSNTKYVFLQLTVDFDNTENYLPVASDIVNLSYATQDAIELVKSQFVNGQIFYAYQQNSFFELQVSVINGTLQRTLISRGDFISRVGRQNLYFQYRHNSALTNIIDPGVTNIIDTYLVNQEYYTAYQNYIKDTTGTVAEPAAPTIDQLSTSYAELNNYKMLTDNLVLNSVSFKPLFGAKAAPELRATIKVVQAQNTTASVSEIKSQVIQFVNNYFTIDKWNFGDNFFFSELSAYLHQNLGSIISSVVLVPLNPQKSFGDLYEVRSAPNEIFVSAATVADVEVITALTQSNIRSQTSVSGLYPTAISQGTSGQSTVITSTQSSSSSSSSGGGGYTPSSGGGGY
jgi:uncharacterized membrane protein YgcG